jgi:hypothetical protein
VNCVVGHPRSGTALVAQILNAGGAQHCRHEYLAALSSMCVPIPTQYYAATVGDDAVDALLRHYDFTPTPWISVDSNWKLTWILPGFLRRFPDARVLHLTRDPRRNVAACHDLDFYGTLRHLAEFRHRDFWLRWMPEVQRDDWLELSALERNCAFWSETHRLAAAALGDHPHTLTVRLEDLRDDDVLTRVFAHFELALPRRRDRRAASARPVNLREPVKRAVLARKPDAVGPWEGWPAQQRERLRELCGETAAALGYEL